MVIFEWLDYFLERFFPSHGASDPFSCAFSLLGSLLWFWGLGAVVDAVLLCIYYPKAFVITLSILIVIASCVYYFLLHNRKPREGEGAARPLLPGNYILSLFILTFAPLYIFMGAVSPISLLVCAIIAVVLYLMVWIRSLIR